MSAATYTPDSQVWLAYNLTMHATCSRAVASNSGFARAQIWQCADSYTLGTPLFLVAIGLIRAMG